MSRIVTACRAFVRSLWDRDAAARIAQALDSTAPLPSTTTVRPSLEPSGSADQAASSPVSTRTSTAATPPPKTVAPAQNPAVTLLATLQREARLIDFLREDLTGYDDSQIGAAVREIHRDCGQTLDRLFEIRPIVDSPEGDPCEVPAGGLEGNFRLTGNVAGSPPFRGTLRHRGWRVAKVDVPTWTGPESASQVLAPAEVEIG